MPLFRRSTLPNAITVGRIVLAPAILLLLLDEDASARLLAFVLFLIAAFSDLWDGYLARKHGWISDFGKLVDPIADKLLLVVTFVPFYVLSHRANAQPLPLWRTLPLWVVLVVFGRELLITVIRALAARRGIVIPAGKAGKYKALAQNIFIGTTIFWYALESAARENGWAGRGWEAWKSFHGAVLAVTLLAAVALTVYSLVVYLWGWRSLVKQVA
ncbi:MAG TPA: CDP-diacylglycerol--glycerol-3-phosphate 3-phosphatidyltransferase [Longimicrobiales bacterium]|nr:CDP-diacylglycerol--glycerol-3-phosphate 3-phosphatidyltransferase [Longimicrobiales bacterium]